MNRTTVGIVLVGAIGGGIAATFVTKAQVKDETLSRAAPEVVNSKKRDPGPGSSRATLEALKSEQDKLRHRLAELERRSDVNDGVPEQRSEEGTPQDNLEAENKAVRGRHDAWRAVHAKEARDAPWSREQETAFGSALETNSSRGGYKVVGVDCRTTLCTAELEWPSYETATQNFRHALHIEVPGCESAVLLERPSDASRPYRATARYDCEGVRTGDSQ